MEHIQLNLNEKGEGAFYLMEESVQLGKMDISVSGSQLTVYHTEIIKEAEGRGASKLLLNAMLEYARTSHLMVVPLCPYVWMQFKRHPEEYADVWSMEEVDGN